MWAQTWENIYDLVVPFPNAKSNLTESLLKKNYTVIKLFKQAEEFFVSMNLSKMTPSFWNHSMIERPKDLNVECHASAYDFYNGYDYRFLSQD